ncbi:MAG: SDH family Clp fold serine proteinase [Bryobacteraceae bacterium]
MDNQALQADYNALTAERKNQLSRISKLRGDRDVLVLAADLGGMKQIPPNFTAISYVDLLPVNDLLSGMTGSHLDLILETPGGYAEVTEEIVGLIRNKYQSFAVIVPGWAKSAGTILTMAADEILMGPVSALGPIDAQLQWQGKQFSADALREGLEIIKGEVQASGILNKAYIPILQNLSPGELQDAQKALDFARDLVKDWLVQYKFKNWAQHKSTGQPVTPEERTQRASEVAEQLGDHRRWKTHGRSLKIQDLQTMRVEITDYSKQPDLADAIGRYYALLQITLSTNIYKLYETASDQIIKAVVLQAPQLPGLQQQMPGGGQAVVNYQCGNCKTVTAIQANLMVQQPVQPGRVPFPANNQFRCPRCGTTHDLTAIRRQVETQAGQPVV